MRPCYRHIQQPDETANIPLLMLEHLMASKGLCRGRNTYIVTTENTNNFAVSVQLAEDPLLHVL